MQLFFFFVFKCRISSAGVHPIHTNFTRPLICRRVSQFADNHRPPWMVSSPVSYRLPMVAYSSSSSSPPTPIPGRDTMVFFSPSSSPVLPPSLFPPRLNMLSYTTRIFNPTSSLHQLAAMQKIGRAMITEALLSVNCNDSFGGKTSTTKKTNNGNRSVKWMAASSFGAIMWLTPAHVVSAADNIKLNEVYEVGELFELGIQLSYLLLLLALLGVGTFFVIRQVLVRRELDLSAKELQEQVRSGEADATEYFELGAVMLRRKIYPAATKYLLQAIEKWDGDDQDLAQVHNALGVSYVLDGKLDKGIAQFENAVKLQPGYVTAWNNLGDAYEKKKELSSALKAFEEVMLFDPNNEVARPRVDSLRKKVNMYKGVPMNVKPKGR
ncbi:hypothetical protein Dimus_024428 [Dionaea muscipula]